MSQNNEDDDIQFQELVGSLLSSHNENLEDGMPEQSQEHEQHLDLPDLHTAEDDLVSVVANAMHNMGVNEGVTHQLHDRSDNNTRQEERDLDNNEEEARQHQEWAQILRQGILETERNTGDGPDDHQPQDNLDDEDENLRRAILESLNDLNAPAKTKESKRSTKKKRKDKERKSTKQEKKANKKSDKKPDRKSEKKSRKKSEKKTSDSNQKSTASGKKAKTKIQSAENLNDDDDDNDLSLLNFEDVIQSFLREGEEAGMKQQTKDDSSLEADEIVEATLQAFENELLNATEKQKDSLRTVKKKNTIKERKKGKKANDKKSDVNHNVLSERKPKVDKRPKEVTISGPTVSSFEEDDFSKALADVVERVVNSSLVDTENIKLTEKPEERIVSKEGKSKSQKKIKEPKSNKSKKDGRKQKSEKTKKPKSTVDEPFDINTIMKNAMSLAFQDQATPEVDNTALDEFNKGLGDITISDILAPSNLAQKKKTITKEKKSSTKKQKEQKTTVEKIAERRRLNQKPPKETRAKKETGHIFIPVEPASSKTTSNEISETDRQLKLALKTERENKKDDKSKSRIPDTSRGPIILDGLKSRPTKIQTLPTTNQQIKVFKINRSDTTTVPKDRLTPKLHRIKFFTAEESKSKPFIQTEKKELSEKERLTKTYLSAVNETIQIAKKKRSIAIKQRKEEEKVERQKRREEKRARRQKEKERREKDSNELAAIVSQGPPYPPNLKLTKSGKPKKPYRRWTDEEMKEREKLSTEELLKPKKIKMVKKKKEKKPKRIPMSTLRKIPLFNLSKGLSPLISSLNYLADSKASKKSAKKPSIVANNMSSEELALNAAKNQTNAYSITYYEPLLDSIVRKELITLHPPWTIPEFPPSALPIVTLLKRDAIDKLVPSQKVAKKNTLQPRLTSAKEKLITTILVPIIKTLKAAAKAKTASGATPEEASRYLATIIQYTKNTIVKAVSNARSSEVKKVKVEGSAVVPRSEKNAIHVIPIFNSSKIGGNINKGNSTNSLLDNISTTNVNLKKPKNDLAIVKIEDENPSLLSEHIPEINVNQKLYTQVSVSEKGTNPYIKEFEQIGSKQRLLSTLEKNELDDLSNQNPCNLKQAHISSDLKSQHNKFASNESECVASGDSLVNDRNIDPNLISTENVDPELRNEVLDSTSTSNFESRLKNDTFETSYVQKSPIKYESLVESYEHFQTENRFDKDSFSHGKSRGSEKEDTGLANATNLDEDDSLNSGLVSSQKKRSLGDSDLDSEGKSHKNTDPSISSMVAKRLKTELSNAQLPNNSTIRNTNTNLLVQKLVREKLADNNDDVNGTEEISDLTELISKTLSSVLPEIERKASQNIVKRIKKHTPNNVLNLDGLVPPLHRAIKNEIGIAGSDSAKSRITLNVGSEKKNGTLDVTLGSNQITTDRSTQKEPERDLRARIKKKANDIFGQGDSAEKKNWIEEEYNQRKIKDEVKQEPDAIERTGFTAMSDEDSLRIIASSMKKLDLARKIEAEVQETVKEITENPPKRKKLPRDKIEIVI
uniref:Regulator of spliceosome components n=1 Tax=Nakaseomyces delphensis TaxID=51657 RepID=A7WPH2_NAKDE|nr:regulator of spliceosome components [Nakaseomyces delphensis]